MIETRSSVDGVDDEAKAGALSMASSLAAEQAMSLLIPYSKLEANRYLIEEQILSSADSFAATTEITFSHVRSRDVTKRGDEGVTTAGVRYHANMELLGQKLDELGLLAEIIPMPKVLLLTDLKVDGVTHDATACEKVFRYQVEAADFVLLEAPGVDLSQAVQTARDDEDISWALEAGKGLGADIVVLVQGRASAGQAKPLLTKVLRPVTAEVRCRAALTVSGKVINDEKHAVTEEAPNLRDSAEAAFVKASKHVARVASANQRFFWVNRYKKGKEISLQLSAIDYDSCHRVLRLLQRLPWVNSAERESLVGDTAVLDISVRDDSSGLAGTVSRLPNMPFEILDITADRILAEAKF